MIIICRITPCVDYAPRTSGFYVSVSASIIWAASYAENDFPKRILLPLRRVSLTKEHTSQPIPMLSDRQFIVSKSNLTAAEESIQRELFWYREELFKCVRGRWKEVSNTL